MEVIKQKIIFIMPSIKTGGGNRVFVELANELVEDGYVIDFIYPNNSDEINTFKCDKLINFIPVGNLAKNKFNKIINIFKMYLFVRKHYTKEIVISSDPIISLFLSLINNKVYRFLQADDYSIFDDLMIFKNNIFLSIYKLLTKLSYKSNINFLFNSKYSYDKFIEVSKRNDVGYKLVHPSLNHKVFFNNNIRKDNEINICIVARKHPMKGFIDFIKPFNEGSIHKIDNIYVISHDDLTEFDLSNVTMIKPKNDEEIAHYMNISHIFISTSWWEGFGLPPLEAMACGCAVLLTDAGGVNEYAVPNENCLMYEPKKQEELIEKLNLLIKDRKLQKKLSNNALHSVENFSWKNSKKQLLDIVNR